MQPYKAPLRDIQFALNEVLNFESHYSNLTGAEDATPDMVNAIIDEAAKLAENVIAPLNKSGDEEGCQWHDGIVTTPTGFKEAHNQFAESGWIGLAHSPKYGGQGLPKSLAIVTKELMSSANHAWCQYPSLSSGAISTIDAHASEEIKARFLPPLVEGKWSGTMCLTEAHCGSDLGLLTTKAEPNADGSYNITGCKIFISAGDHDFCDNIIHIVLARLPDAPAGIKGISLFVVPKVQVDSNGQLGQHNNVTCGSIEKKMGTHGNATCVINFDGAQGYLISQPHKGMSAMFTFINESRLGVAQEGHGHIEASFQNALAYAKERMQMRGSVRKNPQKPADPIIVHADIRRMLLTQKAFAEGGRLLNYFCAKQVDIANKSDNTKQRQQAETLLALLTPIAKGFLTEMSLEATSHGIQVFGGHGFICESGQEQHYRDTRITAIYEGTNTIQGLDLLGRKIIASDAKVMVPFIQQIEEFCNDNTGSFQQQLAQAVQEWQALTKDVQKRAYGSSGKLNGDEINAAAYDYLMYSGYIVLAYFWAQSAVAAQHALDKGTNETQFYQAKLTTAQFYFERLLPRTQSLAITIKSGASNLMNLPEEAFAF